MSEMVSSIPVLNPDAFMEQLKLLNEKLDRLLTERETTALLDGVNAAAMTTSQAARYLVVSSSFLNKSRMPSSKTVGPPYHRNGKKVYYVKTDLDEWRRSTKKECKQHLTRMERRLAAIKEAR